VRGRKRSERSESATGEVGRSKSATLSIQSVGQRCKDVIVKVVVSLCNRVVDNVVKGFD